MPYINQESRDRLCDYGLGKDRPETAGELNYIFTVIALDYLADKGRSYQTMNDIVGAFDNAKDEFRRRIQHPYEDKKIITNGDLFN